MYQSFSNFQCIYYKNLFSLHDSDWWTCAVIQSFLSRINLISSLLYYFQQNWKLLINVSFNQWRPNLVLHNTLRKYWSKKVRINSVNYFSGNIINNYQSSIIISINNVENSTFMRIICSNFLRVYTFGFLQTFLFTILLILLSYWELKFNRKLLNV